ncbi:MAG: hypothetical protein MI892_25850, partial [Desulfobacterales bacterium]|nr:hypothetical protein [Desulfobacterales bacterium]
TGTQYENADQDILYFYDSGINGKGRLTSISHDQEFYNFAYNTLGHLTQVQRTTSFATFTTSFAYDEDGRLESMVYPDGRTVIYGRDTAGNINQVTTAKDGESTTLATDVTYRPFGPATGLTLGNGQEISISYDLNYNPLSINASGALDYSYGYDLASRISSITDNLDSSKSRGFDYDRAGRLTSATGPFGNMTFSYDKTGNRQSTVNDEVTTSFGYDPGSNRLVSITDPDTQTDLTYDDNGRPLTRGDMSYSYTDAGRLATVSEQNAVLAEYVYNSMGQRTSKTIGDKTTVYHYDLEGNLIAESTPEGDFYIDYVYMGQTRLAALASDPDDVFEVSVSTTTGQSVEGIKVYAFTPSGSYTGIYAVTDALGTAVFQSTNLSGTSFKFRADYLTEQFWTETVELTAGSTTLTIQDVDQTVSIIQSGSAVAGVKVYVFDENGRYLGIWGVTDDQGQVSFALPMGYDYQFRADNMGNQYFSQTIEADGEETQIDTQGGILSVNLTRDDSQPITGVKAYLFSESGTYLGQSTTTDIQGGALFSLPSGTYKVRFDYLGYKFWSESIEVTSDTTASVVIPHNELTLSVTKTMAAASEPVAGIKTYLFTESGTYLGISKTTDSTGKAVFLVPEKAYKIRGDYLSGQYWSQPFTWTDPAIAIAQGTVTLTISNVGQPLADVKTYVFSEQGQYLGVNGQSLANGEVSFTLPQGIYTFRADWLNNQYWSDPVTITADQAVAYELSTGGGTVTMTATDGQNPLEGLKTYVFNASGTYLGQNSTTDNAGQVSFTLGQGTYKMRLDYMGSQFWSNEVTIPDDTSINLIVPHTQLTAIVKGVNDGQESALSGIKAYLFSESGTYLGINQTTDENGQVVFNLPNLAFKLRADYLGSQYWSESFTGTNPVIDIGLGTATVKVGSDSSSLAGVKVYVFDSDGTYMGLSAATSEEGTAVFTLPPGTWKFRADYLGSQYWAEGSVIADQDNAIDVDPGGGSIALTVEKPAGQVLAGVKVYAFSSSESYLGLNQTTTDEGIVSFELPEGEYKFRADYLGYKFWTDVLSVPETVSQSLTIPHEDVVVSVAGQYQSAFAVQGVKTYLFSASGSYMGLNATTDANGQVVYSLPNQAYKVRADYLGNQYWSDQIDQT